MDAIDAQNSFVSSPLQQSEIQPMNSHFDKTPTPSPREITANNEFQTKLNNLAYESRIATLERLLETSNHEVDALKREIKRLNNELVDKESQLLQEMAEERRVLLDGRRNLLNRIRILENTPVFQIQEVELSK